MDWINYLNIAKAVYSGSGSLASEEACCRSAISRAYFAAYNISDIRQTTKEKGNKPYGLGEHARLIAYYKQHQDIKRKAIGTSLDRLKDFREFSDYHYPRGRVRISNFPVQAKYVLEETERLIAMVAAL